MTAPRVGRGRRALLVLAGLALTACYRPPAASRPIANIHGSGGLSASGQWVDVQLPVARAFVSMPSQPNFLPPTTGVEDDGAAYRTTIGGQNYGSLQLMVAVSEVDGGIVGQPGEQLGILAPDQVSVVLQADQVLGEDREHRRLDADRKSVV